MATVGVLVASSTRSSAHPRVRITGYNQSVTLTVTDPEVDIDGLASLYAELDRPGRRPFLEHTGRRTQLRRLRMRALLDGTRGTATLDTVEPDMHRLVALADPIENEPVTIAYSTLEASIRWNITGLRFTTKRRRPGDNAVIRCEVDLEFTEHHSSQKAAQSIAVGPPAPPATATPRSTTATPAPPRTSTTRRHTVKAGESLWSIAQQHYGDGNEWRRIADANGITDPRRLAIGAVLNIP